MKLKLMGLYKDFTGEFGVLSFKNGLSTTEVSAIDGRRMAAVVPCVTEDGRNPLDHDIDWGAGDPPISVSPEFTRIITKAERAKALAEANPEAPVQEPPKAWTREALEAVADEKGISGIREIADPLGLKGTSIKGLIDQILSGKIVVDDTNTGNNETQE